MGRGYQGYMQANQSVLEEEDEEEDERNGGSDLEMGRATRRESVSTVLNKNKRRVSWGAEASEMHTLHPNIKQDDQNQLNDDSDDEVPQDFLIETAPGRIRKSQSPTTPRAPSYKGKEPVVSRQRPLYSTNRRTPVTPPNNAAVSIPPRPSELDPEETASTVAEPLSEPPKSRQMRGLDDYERALWNWVNVYNLDAFLQEAYYYYEGKGIYSIALSRGLNLLLVLILLLRCSLCIE